MRRGSRPWAGFAPRASLSASWRWVGRLRRRVLARRWLLALAVAALPVLAILVAVAVEIRTSALLAWAFHRVASALSFRVEPGVDPALRLPRDGPYDVRLGYARLDRLVLRLLAAGYRVTAQARTSGPIDRLADWGLVPAYAENARAGLRIVDRGGRVLYEFAYPRRVYERFADIPDLVVATLLFVENRELLEARPRDNPALEWDRLARALRFRARALAGRDAPQAGGSTLATQLEKFRHSPAGRTEDVAEKLRRPASPTRRRRRDDLSQPSTPGASEFEGAIPTSGGESAVASASDTMSRARRAVAPPDRHEDDEAPAMVCATRKRPALDAWHRRCYESIA